MTTDRISIDPSFNLIYTEAETNALLTPTACLNVVSQRPEVDGLKYLVDEVDYPVNLSDATLCWNRC